MLEFDQIMEQHERDMERCSSSWYWLRSDCYREAEAWWTGAINGAGDRYYACVYWYWYSLGSLVTLRIVLLLIIVLCSLVINSRNSYLVWIVTYTCISVVLFSTWMLMSQAHIYNKVYLSGVLFLCIYSMNRKLEKQL